MPRPVDPKKITLFDELVIREGANTKEAAVRAGVSLSFAYQRVQDMRKDGRLASKRHYEAMRAGGPIAYSNLSAEAKRGWNDFEYFRLRYLGHISEPWQVEAGEIIVASLESQQREYGVMNVPPGGGKALALDTPLATPIGWTTVKDVQPGDWLFDERGQPCQVMFKSEVFYDHDCYVVSTDDGAAVIADADHLWPVQLNGKNLYKPVTPGPGKTGPKPQPYQIHTTARLAKPRGKRPLLTVAAPLSLTDVPLPIDPYVLGCWLGDGHSASARFTAHVDDAPHFIEAFTQAGYIVHEGTTRDTVLLRIVADRNVCSRGHRKAQVGDEWKCRTCDAAAHRHARTGEPLDPITGPLQTVLRSWNLLGNKHVPDLYMRAGTAQRLALLQGLIDTDGYVSPTGHIEFCSTNRRLAVAVQQLAHSLGVKASLAESRALLYGKDCGPKYRVCFYMTAAARLPRKAILCRNGVRTPGRYLTATPCESVPTQCIQVNSPNHLFLAGEGLMVTHNTTILHDAAAWATVRNRGLRGLMGSGTQAKATKMLGRLRRTLERTMPARAEQRQIELGLACDAQATLTEDYGLFRPLDKAEPWRSDALVVVQPHFESTTEKEHTWTAYGLDVDYLGDRIDFAIWDDAVVPRDILTLEKIEAQRLNFDTLSETRLEPGGALWLVGQRIGANDLYRHALDKVKLPESDEELDRLEQLSETELAESYSGLDRKYRHIVFPAHIDKNCHEDHGRDAQAYPVGCLLSPQRLPWRELRSLKHNDPGTYQVWYQQEDTDSHDVLVKKVWVTGGTDPDTGTQHWPAYDKTRRIAELPAGLQGPLYSIAVADPSPTRFWGIQWWIAAPQASNQLFLMDLHKAKMRADEVLEWNQNEGRFTGLMEEWQDRSEKLSLPIQMWVIENNGAQRFLLQYDFVRRWCAQHATNIRPHTTTQRKSDPDYGVYTLREPWRHGRVRLPAGDEDSRLKSLKLADEVQRYPHGWTDDQVMAMWFLTSHLPELTIPPPDGSTLARPSWVSSIPDARALMAVS